MLRKRILTLLAVIATVCFIFPVATVFANTASEKTLLAGTDISLSVQATDLNIEGFTLGTGVTNGVIGSQDGLKKSFGTVLRGQSIVVTFTQTVNVSYFETISLTVGKSIVSNAVFAFYKNVSGETTAKDTYIMDSQTAGKQITLYLAKLPIPTATLAVS